MKKMLCLVCLAVLLPAVLTASAGGTDWQDACHDFILDGGYRSSGQNYNFDEAPSFALYDLDGDGVPELLAYNGAGNHAEGSVYAYAFRDGTCVYAGDVRGDIYSDGFYHYDDPRYPGLVLVTGGMGYYHSVYYTLKDGRIVMEDVADYGEDYNVRTGKSVPYDRRLTDDKALYTLTRSEAGRSYVSFLPAAILDWDAFAGPWTADGGCLHEYHEEVDESSRVYTPCQADPLSHYVSSARVRSVCVLCGDATDWTEVTYPEEGSEHILHGKDPDSVKIIEDTAIYRPCPSDPTRHYVSGYLYGWRCPDCGIDFMAEQRLDEGESMSTPHMWNQLGKCVQCGMKSKQLLTPDRETRQKIYQYTGSIAEDEMVFGTNQKVPYYLGAVLSEGFDPDVRALYATIMERNGMKVDPTTAAFIGYLKKIETLGCGYAAMTNVIFEAFVGREAEFEALFGYPMYNQKGYCNFDAMLVDITSLCSDGYDDNLKKNQLTFFWTLRSFLEQHGLYEEDSYSLQSIKDPYEASAVVYFQGYAKLYIDKEENNVYEEGVTFHWVSVIDREQNKLGNTVYKVSTWGTPAWAKMDDHENVDDLHFLHSYNIKIYRDYSK